MNHLDELMQLKQWVLWRYEPNKDPSKKPVKVPRQANGRKAMTNIPETWSSYSNCLNALTDMFDREGKPYFSGLGFVFTDNDPYIGIDVDGRTSHELTEIFDTYTEITPSGKGLHLIGKLDRPLVKNRKNDTIGLAGCRRDSIG